MKIKRNQNLRLLVTSDDPVDAAREAINLGQDYVGDGWTRWRALRVCYTEDDVFAEVW